MITFEYLPKLHVEYDSKKDTVFFALNRNGLTMHHRAAFTVPYDVFASLVAEFNEKNSQIDALREDIKKAKINNLRSQMGDLQKQIEELEKQLNV